MDALMDNKKLTCRGCHNYLTPPLQVCSNDYAHLICGKCRGKYDECVICNGKVSDLTGRIQETFFTQKYPCKFHLNGCNIMLILQEKSCHENECNYKMFKCEYGRFTGKSCEWEGPYSEIQHHFRSHVKFPFNKIPPLSVKMRIPGRSFNFIQMIKQHNELFWFKYRIDAEHEKVFLVLQMIGTKEQASEFSYELQIISLIDPNSAIHFTEKCYSDSENASNIFESENCAVVSFSKIKNFINDEKLTFNITVKKVKKFMKNPNLPVNTEDVPKSSNSKKNHNQRRRRGQNHSKTRDHSTCSNNSKKAQNNDFEILNLKELQNNLPTPNSKESKRKSDNFESVFFDKSSQSIRNTAPPAYQKNDPFSGGNYQQNVSHVNTARNTQPPSYGNKTAPSTGNNQVPFHQSSTKPITHPLQSNYPNQNSVQTTPNYSQPSTYQNRTFASTESYQVPLRQSPSTSTRQPNNIEYNANQSSQFRAQRERKSKKDDNCVIS